MNGPFDWETDLLMGFKGMTYNEETNDINAHEVIDGDVATLWEYYIGRMRFFDQSFGIAADRPRYAAKILGNTPKPFNWQEQLASGAGNDIHYRYLLYNATHDYIMDGWPTIIYLSEDEQLKVTDLTSVLKPHITAERAKFITGERPLSDFNAFRDELKKMGIDELIQIHVNAVEK